MDGMGWDGMEWHGWMDRSIDTEIDTIYIYRLIIHNMSLINANKLLLAFRQPHSGWPPAVTWMSHDGNPSN